MGAEMFVWDTKTILAVESRSKKKESGGKSGGSGDGGSAKTGGVGFAGGGASGGDDCDDGVDGVDGGDWGIGGEDDDEAQVVGGFLDGDINGTSVTLQQYIRKMFHKNTIVRTL